MFSVIVLDLELVFTGEAKLFWASLLQCIFKLILQETKKVEFKPRSQSDLFIIESDGKCLKKKKKLRTFFILHAFVQGLLHSAYPNYYLMEG